MNTTPRHVIIDLIPLYLAGELSAETKRVVDDYLQGDEALAAHVAAASAENLRLESDTIAPELPDIEVQSVRRTRALLAQQRWLFGLALGLSAVGLSLAASYQNGRVTSVHLMVLDYPIPFGACLIGAAGCWLAYHRSRRRPGGW